MPSIWHETPSLPKSNSNHVICHHPKTAPTVRKIYHHHDKKNPNAAPILLENNNNNNNNNSDQSDYGELRAIVQRIERNRNESKQVVGVSANASGGGGSHSNNNRFQQANKKLVFDYVPASVMMKK